MADRRHVERDEACWGSPVVRKHRIRDLYVRCCVGGRQGDPAAYPILLALAPAYPCGFLRTPADFATRTSRSWSHFTLSWAFLAPISFPETGQKSAMASFLLCINRLRADESSGWIAALATRENNLGGNALRPDATPAASPHQSVESSQTYPARQTWQWRLALH